MSHLGIIAPDNLTHEHNDAQGARQLFQAVLERAFVDATYDGAAHYELRARDAADSWIRWCGRDFRFVCDMAGMDADFLSDAYKAGRVDRHLLKGKENGRAVVSLESGKITKAIMGVLRGEMTATEVARAVLKQEPDLTFNQVDNALRGSLTRTGKATKRKRGGVYVWSLTSEPHTPARDRIAAAVKEVGV